MKLGIRSPSRPLRYFIAAFLPAALLVVLGIWFLSHQDDQRAMTRLGAGEELAVELGRASLVGRDGDTVTVVRKL